jgi:predicted dehydrogenase
MKIGILGLGSIGLRHARNLRMLGHEVLGYDTDEKKMREFQGKIVQRLDIMEHVDAHVIATPTPQHYEDMLECMIEKTPIFIEKPLCAYESLPQDGIEFRPPLENISVGYMLRFHPCVKAAKAWINAGHIGEPLWASFTCAQFNNKPDYLRDGVILNWSHEIDLALYLFGPAKVAAASARVTNGHEDIADIILQHENGARSTIHLDYVTKNEIREAWIVGSEKNIGMDLLGRRNSMGKIIQEFGGKWDDDYIDEMAEWIKLMTPAKIEQVFKLPSPMATGEDGLAVMEICAQARKMAGIE